MYSYSYPIHISNTYESYAISSPDWKTFRCLMDFAVEMSDFLITWDPIFRRVIGCNSASKFLPAGILILASTSRTNLARLQSRQTTETLSNFTQTHLPLVPPSSMASYSSPPLFIHLTPLLDTPQSQPVTLNKPPQKPLPPHPKPSSQTNPSPPTTSPPTPPATTTPPPPNPVQGESTSSTALIFLTSTLTILTKLSMNLVQLSLSTPLSTTRLTTRRVRRMVG